MPAHTWEFPSMSLIVARSHLLSKALSLCISKGRMSEWKLSLVSNLFSHPSTIHPLNLQVHPCSVQQQASVKSSRRLFFTGTPHTYLFRLFLILNVRQRIRKFCSPSSSSSKCVSRWMKCIKKACFGRAFGRIISSVNLSSVNRAEPSVENYNETCEPWRFLFLSRRW